MGLRSDFYDHLYGKVIFPHKGVWSALSSQREDIEILGDYVSHLLDSHLTNKDKDIRHLPMRSAGGVAGLANPPSYFSNLEHALGVSLLGIFASRRIKIKDKTILRNWLQNKDENLVDDFLVALFLRGLYFTTYSDIVLFCDENIRKKLLTLLLKEIKKLLDKLLAEIKIKKLPDRIKPDYILALLGDDIKTDDYRIPILRDVFFGHSTLNLSFMDRMIRTAFYIGSPIGKALEERRIADKTWKLTERLLDFFSNIEISDKQEDSNHVSMTNENIALPIGKSILSTCRELIIKLDDRGEGLGYTSVGKRFIDNNQNKNPTLRKFLLKGFSISILEDPIKFVNPDIVICQGVPKYESPAETYESISKDLKKITNHKLHVLVGKRFPSNFLGLKEKSNELYQYRDFCLTAIPDCCSILLQLDKVSNDKYDHITTAQLQIREKAKYWFENPRMIHPRDF